MSHLPFVLNLDPHPFYNHNMFPNSMYRRQHEREHHPMDFHTLGLISRLAPHFRQLVNGGNKPRDGLSPIVGGEYGGNITRKEGEFSVHLDVGLFLPEELTVKVVNDFLVIEAKHEERESDDSGYISRNFMRRYPLPMGYDPNSIHSKLTTDGVLSVIIPATKDEPKELVIPIQQIGPNDLFVKNKSINGEETEKKVNSE